MMEETSIDRDISWVGMTCVACHLECKTAGEKIIHEKDVTHQKKRGVYSFVLTDCSKLQSSSSSLLQELEKRKENLIGLECFVEIQTCTQDVWWICLLCNDAGNTYGSAISHSQKASHLNFYITTFHPQRKLSIPLSNFLDSYEYDDHIITLANSIFHESGNGNTHPQCVASKYTSAELNDRLMFPYKDETFSLFPIESVDREKRRYVLRCATCHDCFPCINENHQRVWKKHIASCFHANALQIKKHYKKDSFVSSDVWNEPKFQKSSGWKSENGIFHGPLCGLSYLLLSATDGYCMLCYESLESVQSHFTSESHIAQYVGMIHPSKAFALKEKTGPARREGYLDLLMKYPRDNDCQRRIMADCIPSSYLTLQEENRKIYELPPKPEKYFKEIDCIPCQACCVVLPIQEKSVDEVWNEHLDTAEHFDMFGRKQTYSFQEDRYVPFLSSIESPYTDLLNGWTTRKVAGANVRILAFGDVGLEYIVDDLDSREFVCTLCGEVLHRDSKLRCQRHMRSYEHILRYLSFTNKPLSHYLNMQPTQLEKESAIYDYLRRNLCLETTDTSYYLDNRRNKNIIRVHSLLLSRLFNQYVDVPANHPPTNQKLTLGTLIQETSCRLREFYSKKISNVSQVLVQCLDCNMSFTCLLGNLLMAMFEVHLKTAEHNRRSKDLNSLNLRLNGFVMKKSLTFPDKSNQTYWISNIDTGSAEYTRTPVGLCHVTERRSVYGSDVHAPDFYCRLCLVSVPYTIAALEDHVRDISHIVLYMKLTNPVHFFQILEKCGSTTALQVEIADWCRSRQGVLNDNSIYVFDPAVEREELLCSLSSFQELEEMNAIAERNRDLIYLGEVSGRDSDNVPRSPVSPLSPTPSCLDNSYMYSKGMISSNLLCEKSKILLPQLASLSTFTKSILKAKNGDFDSEEMKSRSVELETVGEKEALAQPSTRSLIEEDYYSDESTLSDVATASDIAEMSGADCLAECTPLLYSCSSIGELDSMEKAVKTFLLFQQEKIPEAEIPVAVNEKIAQSEDTLGTESIFQVPCLDDNSFQSFFCSLCKLWMMEKDLVNHIGAHSHKSNYMKIHYRPFFDSLMTETDSVIADSMLNEYAKYLMENCSASGIVFRLKCKVPKACCDKILLKKDEQETTRTDQAESPEKIKLFKHVRKQAIKNGGAKRKKFIEG